MDMKKTSVIFIVVAGIFWGTSAIFSDLLSSLDFTPLNMTAMRAIIAALSMMIYIFVKDKSAFKVKPYELFLYSLGGICTFFSAFFYYESMDVGSVSVAVMLMYTSPIFVITYSCIFLGERLSISKLVSIVVMLVGCAFVSGIIGNASLNVWGICSGLLAGVAYGSYSIVTKIQMNRNMNPASSTLYCFITMSVIAIMVSDIPGIIHTASLEPSKSYPLIIGIGICTEAVPFFLFTMALKHIPAGVASALSIVEPVMATVFAMFLGEIPGFLAFVGIVMVMSSVLVLSRVKE